MDAYERALAQRRKDIEAGVIEAKPKPTAAEHMRNYRQRLKAKQAPAEPRLITDEAIEQAIYGRGRQLNDMMQNPMYMWPVLLPHPDRPQPEKKHRKCLNCERQFMSDGPGNRLCLRCKKDKSFGWMLHQD